MEKDQNTNSETQNDEVEEIKAEELNNMNFRYLRK